MPTYWAGWNDEGHATSFIWRIIRESSSSRLSLLNGDVHMAFDLSTEDADAVAKEAGFKVNDQQGLGVFAVKLNNQRGPFSDVNVRKAVSYAMDYDSIITALNGGAVLLDGPLPNMGEFNDSSLVPYRFDMEKAKAALAQSSEYAAGGFEVEYVYVTGLQIEEQIGLILLDKLSQLNITVKMVTSGVAGYGVACLDGGNRARHDGGVFRHELRRPRQLPVAGVPLQPGGILGGGIALQEPGSR